MALNKTYVKYLEESISKRIPQGTTTTSGTSHSSTSKTTPIHCTNAPAFLSAGTVEWPRTVLELLDSVEVHSQIGYFQELQRCWVTVDNTLVMWNPFNGKDMVVFNGFTQMIVAVSDPIEPVGNVFVSSVTRIIALASCETLSLIGVQQSVGDGVTESRLLDLEYTVDLPCVMTKLCRGPGQRGLYATGADGNIYSVQYRRASMFSPCLTVTPVTSLPIPALATITSAVKSLWKSSDPPLVDVVSTETCLFTLTSDGTLSAYTALQDGSLKYCCKLSNLNIVALHADINNEVVGIAEDGTLTQFSLYYGWSSPKLSTSGLNHGIDGICISRSYYAHGVLACSCTLQAASGNGDSVMLLDTVGKAKLEVDDPTGHLRVEAICELVPMTQYAIPGASAIGSGSRTVAVEALAPPRQFLLLHRSGVSCYVRLRPVDVLHWLFDRRCTTTECKAAFNSDATTLCAMALQLAARICASDALAVVKDAPVRRHASGGFRSPSRNGSDEALVQAFFYGASPDVARRASELLREFSSVPPPIDRMVGDQRELAFPLSPFVRGVSELLSQILRPLQNTPCFTKVAPNVFAIGTTESLRTADRNLQRLVQFLEQVRGDLWRHVPSVSRGTSSGPSADLASSSFTIENDTMRNVIIKVFVSKTQIISADEHAYIQSAAITASIDFAKRASQILTFLVLCGRFGHGTISSIANSNSKKNLTIGKLLTHPEEMRALARDFANAAVSSSSSAPTSRFGRQLSSLMLEMERDCSFIFESADQAEYDIRMQFSEVFDHHASPSAIRGVVQKASQAAGVMFKSGALDEIVQRLSELNHEQEGIALYIHAAAQLAPDCEERSKIMQTVTTRLQDIYFRDRVLFDRIIGNQSTRGSIWDVERNDSRTHLELLHWLGMSRDSAEVTTALRQSLIWANSPQLEKYLSMNVSALGLVYVQYLRLRCEDHVKAVNVCLRLLQDPLIHVDEMERLDLRVQFAREAFECAISGNVLQRNSVEFASRSLLLQVRLRDCIQCCLQQPSSSNDDEQAQEDLKTVSSQILSAETIFGLALQYEHTGGIEVALTVLEGSQCFDGDIIEQLLRRLIMQGMTEQIKSVLRQHGMRDEFPLASFISSYESWVTDRPGSLSCPQLLLDAHVDGQKALMAYEDLLEQRIMPVAVTAGEPCPTRCQFTYSMAELLIHAVLSVAEQDYYAASLRNIIQQLAAEVLDGAESNLLMAAAELLDRAGL